MGGLDAISITLQVIASAVTLWALWQMGNKSLLGPALSIVSDFAFVTLNIYQHLWALVPFCGVLLILHIRNLIKWRRDAQREAVEAEDKRTAAVSGDHPERRAAKAYSVLLRGELR